MVVATSAFSSPIDSVTEFHDTQPAQSFTNYDTLRKQNREEYEAKRTNIYHKKEPPGTSQKHPPRPSSNPDHGTFTNTLILLNADILHFLKQFSFQFTRQINMAMLWNRKIIFTCLIKQQRMNF